MKEADHRCRRRRRRNHHRHTRRAHSNQSLLQQRGRMNVYYRMACVACATLDMLYQSLRHSFRQI